MYTIFKQYLATTYRTLTSLHIDRTLDFLSLKLHRIAIWLTHMAKVFNKCSYSCFSKKKRIPDIFFPMKFLRATECENLFKKILSLNMLKD